jgi:hypothetical protein
MAVGIAGTLAGIASMLLVGCNPSATADVDTPHARSAAAQFAERARTDEQPAGHQRMVALLQQLKESQLADNYLMSDIAAREARNRIKLLPKGSNELDRWNAEYQAGIAELNQGKEDVALEHFEDAARLFENVQGQLPDAVAQEFLCRRAIAYLRFGETQNCCARNNADSCLLPIRGQGIHTRPEGSRRAIELFTEMLQQSSRQSSLHYRALWLLNLAYMTLGEHPDGVPQEYLIPPQAFESEEEFPRFPNIAKRVGLDQFNLAGGVIADDFDNDNYLDLVVSNWDLGGQIRFYRNMQDGSFSDRTEQCGLTGITGGLNIVQADYDNDGWLDFLCHAAPGCRKEADIPRR